MRQSQNQPKHGLGWNIENWETFRVYKRARGFGEDTWLQELQCSAFFHKPGETALEARYRMAQFFDVPSEDLVLEVIS